MPHRPGMLRLRPIRTKADGRYLVAVVDDEDSVRCALARLLRVADFQVETFSSGAEFLESLARRSPDCVVLDLRMPRLSGFEVQRAIRESGARTPVVLVTADDSTESRERAFEEGAGAWLRKPVDDALLLEAIHAAIQPAPTCIPPVACGEKIRDR